MTEDRRSQLAVLLFDSYISMQRREVKNLSEYSNEYQRIIKIVCPEKSISQVTSCDIMEHLIKHRNPEQTIIEILKQLKED
jgi:hypothetical protein